MGFFFAGINHRNETATSDASSAFAQWTRTCWIYHTYARCLASAVVSKLCTWCGTRANHDWSFDALLGSSLCIDTSRGLPWISKIVTSMCPNTLRHRCRRCRSSSQSSDWHVLATHNDYTTRLDILCGTYMTKIFENYYYFVFGF